MYNIMFCRFPFGASEHPEVTDWMVKTLIKCKSMPSVASTFSAKIDDTPITMGRNRAVKAAREANCHYLVMIDSDMVPDLAIPGARPFWDSSWEFMMQQREDGPCVIAAPYCGPPPHENVYVFRWSNRQNDNPNAGFSLQQFEREEAAFRGGIEEVAALPTGLIIFDMRAFTMIPPPYFQYEYEDEFETHKATTEDVFCTRNLSICGVPQYCNWDAWAGHVKRKIVSKPVITTSDDVREEYRKAILSGRKSNEQLRFITCSDKSRKVDADPVEDDRPILDLPVSPSVSLCSVDRPA
jgi:hypothetical protein